MSLTLERLRAANAARQLEWQRDPEGRYVPVSLVYRGNELGGEAGEAQNVIKKIERERLGMPGSRATREQLARELHDVLICVDLVAMHENIDLAQAVVDGFNAKSVELGLKTRIEPQEDDEVMAFRKHEEQRDEVMERVAQRHGKAKAATLLGVAERTVYNAIARQRAKRAANVDKGIIG